MNEEIKEIFSVVTVPVAHLKYKGNEKTYITWNIISDIPVFFVDDEIEYSEVKVDIDIFSDKNYLSLMNLIKQIMKSAEWTWIEDSEEMYENDTNLYHRTCTFSKERKV